MSIQSILHQIIKEALADSTDQRPDVNQINEYWVQLTIQMNKLIDDLNYKALDGD